MIDSRSEDKTTEWNEGRAAYEAGEPESKCPYGMLMQWTRWADWVCGYGEAKQEAFARTPVREWKE